MERQIISIPYCNTGISKPISLVLLTSLSLVRVQVLLDYFLRVYILHMKMIQ